MSLSAATVDKGTLKDMTEAEWELLAALLAGGGQGQRGKANGDSRDTGDSRPKGERDD